MSESVSKIVDFQGTEDSQSPAPECSAARLTGQAGPSGEIAPGDPELFERARSAVAALRGRGRQGNGQAAAGNTLAVRHGLRSAQLLEQPDIGAWHREQVEAITADLGGASELSALQRASVRETARLEVILAALGDELLAGGVLTGKGKLRAATTCYLQVLDRFVKVAGTVGLQRVAKRLNVAEQFAALHADHPR